MDPDIDAPEQPDERRRIIDAAWRVLDRSAYQGLKVGAVVRAVPTSTRAFYRWFDDKDDLVAELVCEEYRRAGRRLHAVMHGAPAPEAIDRWIETYVRAAATPYLAARARLFSSARTDAPWSSARITAALDEFLSPLRLTIERGCSDGTLATDDPGGDAVSIHHLCANALLDVLGADPADAAEVAEAATRRVTSFARRALGRRVEHDMLPP